MATLRMSRRSGRIKPEKLRSSHWGNCKFCDLDGRKWLNQLTLDCGKVRRAKWPIRIVPTFPFNIQGRPSQYSQGTRFIIILWLHHILSLGNPILSVATKELSESVLLAVSIASKGILFISPWHCIRIVQSYWRPVLQLRHCLSLQFFAADLSELAKCAVPSGLSHRLCCNI